MTIGKHASASTPERFKVQRDRGGSDWSVIDTRAKNIPVASGLDFAEAQQTAEARNKKRWSKKECFKECLKTIRRAAKQ